MRQQIVLALTLLFCMAPFAQAGVLYPVSVDTSTIGGTLGSLDFQFNPGPLVSQPASLAILNFATDGTLTGSPFPFGDVGGGPLPAIVYFDNGGQLNDYFQAFTFGASLKFDVLLYGPAVEYPDGTSASGSTFAFSMFSDPAGTVPALTSDPNGFAATVGINLDGTTTVTVPSPQTRIGAPTLVPEPGSFAVIGTMIVLAGAFLRLRRHSVH